jgi:uncharacterized GH25 family protein
MKKRIFMLILALSVLCLPAALSAHDMWATAKSPEADKPLTLVIGYGHHYPTPEDIPAEELPFFQVKLVGPDGEIPITASKTPNYQWTTNDPVKAGSYLFISDVKPIFWTQTPDGEYHMKPKNEVPGADNCGDFIENAKGIINVGTPGNDSLVTKPAGLPLEIVPKANPASLKRGDKLALSVYQAGKPAPGVKIEGRYSGYEQLIGSPDAKAFSTVTDVKGDATFVALEPGDWILTARYEEPYKDTAKCDKTDYGTSLYLTVAK